MTPYQCQRVRFGILAARDTYERHRLTEDQVEDLEGMEFEGWQIKDSIKAYDHERANIHARAKKGRPHVWIYPM